MAPSVAAPAGSMSQTTRGAARPATISRAARCATTLGSSPASLSATSKLRFRACTLTPPRASRRAMLPPMRPSP
jgi:hypothetical protein